MDYEKIYYKLGFQPEPLPSNYNPDTYAKKLMQNIKRPEGVIYAISTDNYNTDVSFHE